MRSDGTILKEIYVNPHLDTLIFIVPEWAQQIFDSDHAVPKIIERYWGLGVEENSVVASGHHPSKSGYWTRATHSLVQVQGEEWDDEGRDVKTLILVVLPHAEYKDNEVDDDEWEPEEIAYEIAELLFPDIDFGGFESIEILLYSWDGFWKCLLDGVQELLDNWQGDSDS